MSTIVVIKLSVTSRKYFLVFNSDANKFGKIYTLKLSSIFIKTGMVRLEKNGACNLQLVSFTLFHVFLKNLCLLVLRIYVKGI